MQLTFTEAKYRPMTTRYEYKGIRFLIVRYCRIMQGGKSMSGVAYVRESDPDNLLVMELVSFNEKFRPNQDRPVVNSK